MRRGLTCGEENVNIQELNAAVLLVLQSRSAQIIMAPENKVRLEREQLRLQRNREIDFLQNLRISLLQTKNELKTDLTRLAIRNLPIMDSTIEEQGDKFKKETTSSSNQIVQSSITDSMEQVEIQQLEPLDLDI